MAGKLRVAAKLILGTTVLASGGGGAYYYTTHGLALPGFMLSEKPPAVAELDAVASAWAETSKSHAVDPRESSPVARSAKPVEPLAEKKVEKTSIDDRYGPIVTPPIEAVKETVAAEPVVKQDEAVAKDEPTAVAPVAAPTVAKSEAAVDKSKAIAEREPTPAVEEQPVTLAAPTEAAREKSTASDDVPSPTIATPAPSEAQVARGQEPKDDLATKPNDPAGDIENAFAGSGSGLKPLAEPKPLDAPAQPTNIGDSSTRAKQAFGNTAPAANTDRYGNPLPAPREAQPSANNGGLSNPFVAKSATAPSASKAETIEPLSTPPNELSIPARSLDQGQSRGGLRPLDEAGSASSVNRDLPRTKTPVGLPPSRDSLQNSYPRPLPTNNSLGRGNDDITPIIAGDGAGKPGEKALEGPQQPTLVIQKFAPGEVQVGKPAKFVVQVRNAGAQAADDVTIRDEIPQGTKLVSTSPNASSEGGRVVWKLGKLSPGEDRTVEMQLMPTTEGDIGSVATVTYSAQASVKTHCTMPQLAIRMTATNEVMIGNQQHVKIEIKNPGTGDATHVMLFENVPQNVKHAAGPTLEFEIGTLHAGETRELDLVLTAEKAGKVVNALTAKADGNLQVQQQVEFEVIAPGLTVGLDGPERRYLERPATYEVSVQNPGTAAAHDIQIVTKLPKGMKFVRANNMGEYDAATHAVYWSLAELPKGESGKVELVAMPTETGPQTLQVEGRAQQGLADQKQREIMVEGLAAIMFEVRDLVDPIEVGGETGYEIRIMNQGSKAATNVQVSVDIPAGMKIVSAEGESGHKIQDGHLVFEPLQQLAPKADTVYRVRAQGLQPGDQRINVQVNTDDLEHPIRREESTRVFGDQ